jgi:hypothetical protein
VNSISEPSGEKGKVLFQIPRRMQKRCRKKIRTSTSKIRDIKYPARFWFRQDVIDVLYACVILHNRIFCDDKASIEEESVAEESTSETRDETEVRPQTQNVESHRPASDIQVSMMMIDYVQRHMQITDASEHVLLKHDLMDYIYGKFHNQS